MLLALSKAHMKRWLALAVTGMAMAFVSATGAAQTGAPSPRFTSIEGDCAQLVVDATDLSSSCSDSASLISYDTNNLGMLFTANEAALVTFFGNAVPDENDDRVIAVTHVRLKVGESPVETIAVSGACTQIDRAAGGSTISCSANGATRTFRAEFIVGP
jgi:hypothetical protein